MFNIRLLGVASIRFSDIKHRNEHSLFSCANLKALPIFKNIHIYGQEESLQFLLIDESVSLEIVYKGRNGFGGRGKSQTEALPSQLA